MMQTQIHADKKGRDSRRFKISIIFLSTLYLLLSTLLCYGQAISSTELINKAKDYDGKEVLYEGEIIGEIMARGNFAWINVNDGQNAIGIWVEKPLIKTIACIGSYKMSGDWIQIKGVFNRSCREHGGDFDIHATELKKIKSGQVLSQPIEFAKTSLLVSLLIILSVEIVILLILHILRIKFKRSTPAG